MPFYKKIELSFALTLIIFYKLVKKIYSIKCHQNA